MASNPMEHILYWKNRFFEGLIYRGDIRHFSWPKRNIIKVVRIMTAVLRDLSDGQLNMRAMSLVYTTLLSMVPLLAISFSVLKGFGVHNQVEPFLLNLLYPLGDERYELVDQVITFVDNVKVGVLGVFGLAFLLYTVIALMTKIERAFNYTWNVTEARRFAARFSDYLSVLMIGPLLIFISVGLTASISNADLFAQLTDMRLIGAAAEGIMLIVPYIMLTLAFAFIYTFMPNTRVKPLPAITAGAVTAIMWKALGFAFAALVVGSAKYSAIYSAFATLVIFMIWLYSGWLVVLIGASLAYYIQNPSNVLISRGHVTMSNQMRERLALSIISRVGLSFYTDAKPYTIEDLAEALKLPIRLIDKTVDTLKSEKIVFEDREKPYHLIPGCPYDQVRMCDVLIALRSANTDKGFISSRAQSEGKVKEMMQLIDVALEHELGDLTVKGWVLDIARKKQKNKQKRKAKKK
ncbi:MAG: YihY/virulence factor BrkB family protein [Pseudomonadota bacterium]